MSQIPITSQLINAGRYEPFWDNSIIIEDVSEDNCDLRVTDAATALETETELAVIVVDTDSSTMTEFTK